MTGVAPTGASAAETQRRSVSTAGEAARASGGSARREAEGTSLLSIPPYSSQEGEEGEKPTLHRPEVVEPPEVFQRSGAKGARPKDKVRYNTRTIREEWESRSQGDRHPFEIRTDFYLPIPGQPRITELHSWRAPICMEQGNEGIYVRINEWRDTYGTNVYVIDEVTGRIYADVGGELRRIPVICSHRKRDEQELAAALKERGVGDTGAWEATGGLTVPPSTGNTPEEPKGVNPEQPHLRVASVKAQVREEVPMTTPSVRERSQDSPIGVIRPVTGTSTSHLGVEGTTPSPDREEELADQLDEAWLAARRNMITQSLSPAARNIRPRRWEDLRYEQARRAQQRVLDLRNSRYTLEVSLLNQHLRAVEKEALTGSALQEARDEVMRIYSHHLQTEIEPLLDYLRVVDPADVDELEIPDEEEIEFQYHRNTRWTEEEYIRLLFQLRRHWYQSATWDDLFRFVVRSRPRLMESHNYRMSHMISEWRYQQEKGLLWKEWAERVLNYEPFPEGPSNEEDWIPEGGNFRRYVSITNPPRMPDDVLIPPTDFASSVTDSPREGHTSPKEGAPPREEEEPRREGPTQEEKSALTPAEERDVERRRAVQAVREITAPRQTSAEQDGQRYDWDALCDAPLGLPTELPNRVSDPGTPPIESRGVTRGPESAQKQMPSPKSRPGEAISVGNGPDGQVARGTGGRKEDTLPTQVTKRRSRIPIPVPRVSDTAIQDEGGQLGREQGYSGQEFTTREREVPPLWETVEKRQEVRGYEPTPTGPPPQGDAQPQRLNFETPIEGDYGPCFICNEPGHVSGRCPGGWRRESEDPRSHTSEEGEPLNERCRNCNGTHQGICPCGWCNQLGHIAAQCTAKHDSEEMNQRFPKRQKTKKPPVAKYQCWKCSQYHSFKEYCPNITHPPPRPGECKACGRTSGRHAPGCDYDAIRRRLLLCTFCGKSGHLQQDCWEKRRLRNREQGVSRPTDPPERNREGREEAARDWEHPGVYPKWEPHPDGFEVLNRGRPPTHITTPVVERDIPPKQVRIDETVPKEV